MKIKLSRDGDIPLSKMLYFPTIVVITKCIFEKDGKYYHGCYLDECLYQV